MNRARADMDRLEATYLPTTVGGIDFHNPFCVGSGPTVKTVDMIRKIDRAGWGAEGGRSISRAKISIAPAPIMPIKMMVLIGGQVAFAERHARSHHPTAEDVTRDGLAVIIRIGDDA